MCLLYMMVKIIYSSTGTGCNQISLAFGCVRDAIRFVVWCACFAFCPRTLGQVSELQRQDMVDLGSVILALACRHPVTAASRGESLAFTAQHYTPELHNLAASLVSKKPPSVFEVRAVLVTILP